MENLEALIYHHIDPFDAIEAAGRTFEPTRIAILDSGFDPNNPLLITDDQRIDPRIRDARSFVCQTESHDFQDEIGHGTHALGLLLKVATSCEIYIAKVAHRATLDRDSYNDIAKARLAAAETGCSPKLTVHTGNKSRSHRVECGHPIDVIRDPRIQRAFKNSDITCSLQKSSDVCGGIE